MCARVLPGTEETLLINAPTRSAKVSIFVTHYEKFILTFMMLRLPAALLLFCFFENFLSFFQGPKLLFENE